MPQPADLAPAHIDEENPGEDQIDGIPVIWLSNRQAINATHLKQAQDLPGSPKLIFGNLNRRRPIKIEHPGAFAVLMPLDA